MGTEAAGERPRSDPSRLHSTAVLGVQCAEDEAAFPDRGNCPLEAELDGRRYRLVHTYGAAAIGECVALINSWSMLELACREGSAAQQLGLRAGQTVWLTAERAGSSAGSRARSDPR